MFSGVIIKRIFIAATLLSALVLMAPSAVAKAPVSAQSSPAELRAYVKKVDELIKSDPQARYYGAKGQALEWLKDYLGAVDAFTSELKLDPNDQIARFRRGENYRHLLRDREAIEDYSKAITSGMEKACVYSSRSLCKHSIRDFKGSLEDASKALLLDPKDKMAWYCKGSSEFDLGLHEKGLSSLGEAIRLNPNDASNWVARGRFLSKLGKKQEASKNFTTARRLGWKGSFFD